MGKLEKTQPTNSIQTHHKDTTNVKVSKGQKELPHYCRNIPDTLQLCTGIYWNHKTQHSHQNQRTWETLQTKTTRKICSSWTCPKTSWTWNLFQNTEVLDNTSNHYVRLHMEAIAIHKHQQNFNKKEEGIKLNIAWLPILKNTACKRSMNSTQPQGPGIIAQKRPANDTHQSQ